MKFAKIVFLIAGIYGVLILTPIYFLEDKIARENPPPITHPEFFYGFLGVALVWQFLFLALSTDPLRYRLMMLPCILEKLSYGITLAVLFARHRIPFSAVAIGSGDWIFAALFIAAYLATRPNHNVGAMNRP